jgi:isoquinoline 1-oxidoreductase beta subunit
MSINTFAVESAIDELAILAGQDPLQYRLNMCTDPRWAGVLNAVADLCNWSAGPPAGHFYGIAAAQYANSYVAEVADVSLATGNGLDGHPNVFKVNAVYVALDCYLAVNPGQIETQLAGGITHGLNAALYGQQSFSSGVPQRSTFHDNRVIRMDEMPQVFTTLIPNPVQSSPSVNLGGVGEIGVPCIAPAIANAYFQASRVRLRTLPFFPGSIMQGLFFYGT